METLLENIKNKDELNLPNSKLRIQTLECRDIVNGILKLFKDFLLVANKKITEEGFYEFFGEEFSKFWKDSQKIYNDKSLKFDQEIREKIRIDLVKEFHKDTKTMLVSQISKINSILDKHISDINDENISYKGTKKLERFLPKIEALTNDAKTMISKSMVEGLNLEETLQEAEKEFIEKMRKFKEDTTKFSIAQFGKIQIGKISTEAERLVASLLENLNSNFYDDVFASYQSHIKSSENEILNEFEGNFSNKDLFKVFKMDNNLLISQIEAVKLEIYNAYYKVLSNYISSEKLDPFLEEKFNEILEECIKNAPPNWSVSDRQSLDFFIKKPALNEIESLIRMLSIMNIVNPKNCKFQ